MAWSEPISDANARHQDANQKSLLEASLCGLIQLARLMSNLNCSSNFLAPVSFEFSNPHPQNQAPLRNDLSTCFLSSELSALIFLLLNLFTFNPEFLPRGLIGLALLNVNPLSFFAGFFCPITSFSACSWSVGLWSSFHRGVGLVWSIS